MKNGKGKFYAQQVEKLAAQLNQNVLLPGDIVIVNLNPEFPNRNLKYARVAQILQNKEVRVYFDQKERHKENVQPENVFPLKRLQVPQPATLKELNAFVRSNSESLFALIDEKVEIETLELLRRNGIGLGAQVLIAPDQIHVEDLEQVSAAIAKLDEIDRASISRLQGEVQSWTRELFEGMLSVGKPAACCCCCCCSISIAPY
jgi:hypothetical protein